MQLDFCAGGGWIKYRYPQSNSAEVYRAVYSSYRNLEEVFGVFSWTKHFLSWLACYPLTAMIPPARYDCTSPPFHQSNTENTYTRICGQHLSPLEFKKWQHSRLHPSTRQLADNWSVFQTTATFKPQSRCLTRVQIQGFQKLTQD